MRSYTTVLVIFCSQLGDHCHWFPVVKFVDESNMQNPHWRMTREVIRYAGECGKRHQHACEFMTLQFCNGPWCPRMPIDLVSLTEQYALCIIFFWSHFSFSLDLKFISLYVIFKDVLSIWIYLYLRCLDHGLNISFLSRFYICRGRGKFDNRSRNRFQYGKWS